ncbi:MAG: DMT family transporter [Hornefia sp.]|nr:DMT family transporter [Hornefia sp.]
MKKNTVYFLILIISTFWGLSFIALTVLMKWLDPLQIIAVRWTLASFIFISMMAAGKLRINIKKENFKYLLLTGILEPGIYSVLEVYGLSYTSASISSIFIATIPCMSLILGFFIFKIRPGRMGLISIFVAFTGVLICTYFTPGFSTGGHLVGYGFMIGAVFVGTLYGFISAKASKDYSAIEITTVMAFVGMVFFNLANVIRGNFVLSYTTIFSQAQAAGCIIFLGIFCSALCYIALNKILANIDPSIANNMIGSSITVIGVVAGVVINNDPAGIYTVIGVGLTLIGVYLSSKEVKDTN